MLQMHPDERPQPDPTVRVGWTIDKEGIQELTERELFEPHVLIIVTEKSPREQRKVEERNTPIATEETSDSTPQDEPSNENNSEEEQAEDDEREENVDTEEDDDDLEDDLDPESVQAGYGDEPELLDSWDDDEEDIDADPDFEFAEVSVKRQLVPLSHGATYVQFNRPGDYRIYGIVVGNSSGKFNRLYETHVSRRCLEVSYTGRIWGPNALWYTQRHHLDVTVGEEFFAEEPAQWERRWVNLWFETSPKDQCQFIRRRFLAYSIQPVVWLLWFVIIRLGLRTAAPIALLLGGYRRINWHAVFHPFKHPVDEIWEDVSRNDSVFYEGKDSRDDRKWAAFFMPYMLAFYLTLYLTWNFWGPTLSWFVTDWVLWLLTSWVLWIPVMVVMAFIAVMMLAEFVKKRRALAKQAKERAVEAELRTNMEDLDTALNEAKVRKPFRLRYLEAKAKRCRPYLYG